MEKQLQPQKEQFNVHWTDEDTGAREEVQIEIPSYSIVLDAIMAAIEAFNRKWATEKPAHGIRLNKDPNLYSLMLADEDFEPEEPGILRVNSF